MAEETPIAEAVEEAAGEQLGVQRWDRPAIFREVAAAAVDSNIPYWAILVLSGAIATLGLALNSSAVVIGAMLVAPLLAPIVGLALALAVGDGRLALQAGIIVLASALAVVLTSALLTLALPFQSVTLEISSRTRPSLLDLGIAIFSGLVGAMVTVMRGNRLSAAIPGVAVAVALIPPLAVTGFGMGAGWNEDIIGGSLLLFGANLAGIVLSGVGLFLLVGMQRSEVAKAARAFHGEGAANGLAALVLRPRWTRSLGVFASPRRRILMVAGFTAILAVPLVGTLRQITRETRVNAAVDEAAAAFDEADRASILGRSVTFGREQSRVHLRVATTRWFGDEARQEFERMASARAGEPVRLVLEQLPATVGDLEALADLIPDAAPPAVAPPPVPTGLPELLEGARGRARDAVDGLHFPGETAPIGIRVVAGQGGRDSVHVVYLDDEPLASQAEAILAAGLRDALGEPELGVAFERLELPPALARARAGEAEAVAAVAALLSDHPGLRLEVAAQADEPAAAALVEALRAAGVNEDRLVRVEADEPGVRLALTAGPLQPSDEQG